MKELQRYLKSKGFKVAYIKRKKNDVYYINEVVNEFTRADLQEYAKIKKVSINNDIEDLRKLLKNDIYNMCFSKSLNIQHKYIIMVLIIIIEIALFAYGLHYLLSL